MRHTALRYLIASQASLVSGLLICFLLEPAVVAGPKGFSNYGVATPTIIPYTLAFVLASLFAALAARRLIPNTHRIILLKRGLFILAALYLAVLISTYPYQSAQWLRALHITTGTTLFSWQILFAGWLLTTSKRNCINCILFAALLAG